MEHRTALLWLRRDLRLTDNPALIEALQQAEQVIPVFIHAPEEAAPWVPGAASNWWLHHSLVDLAQSLEARGSRLIIRQGASFAALQQLIAETGATLVCWNRLYEPACIARDTHIKATLIEHGIAVSSHNAALLFEPWTVKNAQGKPFKVFTPYWKHCAAQLGWQALPPAAPDRLPVVNSALSSLPVHDLQLLPRIAWDAGFNSAWQVSEHGALKRLEQFIEHAANHYLRDRDRPDINGTSLLSPYLHAGQIGPRQILAALTTQGIEASGYVRELGWREFAHHLLYHFPQSPEQPLDKRFEHFPWANNLKHLHAWQRGMTGIPLVDAGMRQLWHTGFMHNRVRMVVASFLTKNLRLNWQHGARWFWDTLVDANLANNTQGWQWTAGCGADAAPYFRVFNPVLQAQKFDPQGHYIRAWIPELKLLPDKWLAQPWTAPESVLHEAGIELGNHYLLPIIELSSSRSDALAAYAQIKTTATAHTTAKTPN